MAFSRRTLHLLNSSRGISSTPHLASLGWFDKIKTTFTGKKQDDMPFPPSDSFTLVSKHSPSHPDPLSYSGGRPDSALGFAEFADSMDTARKVGTFKNFVSGRSGEATVGAAFEKHSAVLRYLATIDPSGEVYNDHLILEQMRRS
jgi:hypothetical protein